MSEIVIGVCFKRDEYVIELRSGENRAKIELENCTDSAALLNALFQLSLNRPFAVLMPEIYEVLEEACGLVFGQSAHEVYCPQGVDRSVSWRDATSVAKGTKPRAGRPKKEKDGVDRTRTTMPPA